MKRIVSLVLALSMVLSMFSFSFAGTALSDVEGTDCEAAVSALVELGVVKGYGDGTYKPEDAVSRAEMAKLLVVSAGLEPAADVSKGATKFSDVAADHWATGYINVATEYGYINGYPEGTFDPDATVSYAEAATMAIRVLGYKSVVEAKGTWPTNYIAKAQELKVLRDVEYGKYTEGATRGNVALLMWNMLRTNMWDVDSESENSGLTYRDTGVTMIDKYFEDYTYISEDAELVVTNITVSEGEVKLELTGEDKNGDPVVTEYKLARDIEFLDLLGRTVSVLYNKDKDREELVMVIPSAEDTVVEGYVDTLSGDGYTLHVSGDRKNWGTASGDSFVSGVIRSKKVFDAITVFDASETCIVKEVEKVKGNYDVTAIDDTVAFSIPAEAIVLIDGKWATVADLEAGDVLTELDADDLYIVSRGTVEGKFEDVTKSKDSEDDEYYVTVGAEKYDVATGVDYVVEVDEKGKEETTTLESIRTAKKGESEFLGEDCVVFLNYLGEVVRIEFAEIDVENAGEFYVLTYVHPTTQVPYWTVSGKNGGVGIELNGEDYVVDIDSGDSVYGLGSGEVVYVEFNKDDETVLTKQVKGSGESFGGYQYFTVDSGDTSGDEILDDYNRAGGTYKVTNSTKVYTIVEVMKADDDTVVDHYEVEITNGAEALKGVEEAIVAVESGDAFNKAAYVFVWEEAKNTEKTFGIVKGAKESSKDGVMIDIDGTFYEIDALLSTVEAYVGQLVAFVENDGEVEISKAFTMANVLAVSGERRVEDINGSLVDFASGDDWDIDEMVADTHEDHKVVVVSVKKDSDGVYQFNSYNAEYTIEDLESVIKVDDIVLESATEDKVDVIVIIRGLKK